MIRPSVRTRGIRFIGRMVNAWRGHAGSVVLLFLRKYLRSRPCFATLTEYLMG